MFGALSRIRYGLVLLAASVVGMLLPAPVLAEGKHEGPIRIGMVGTLFRDVPASLVLAMMHPFGMLMKSQTGMDGKLLPGGDPYEVAQQIVDGKLDLAVLHGVEFGWVRAKHPELRPLMIAVNQQKHFTVHLVVRSDDTIKSLEDLKGTKLALAKGSREHVRMFLNKQCGPFCPDFEKFFKTITVPANTEDALDDVVDGEVQAAVVENVPFEAFARRKPGRAAQLKTLTVSETFPSGVIVYKHGALDDETLDRFRTGMVNANKNIMGKQMLMMWKLTGFEAIPADYDTVLNDIVKAYPAAAPKVEVKTVSREKAPAPVTVVKPVEEKKPAPVVEKKPAPAPAVEEEKPAPAVEEEKPAPAAEEEKPAPAALPEEAPAPAEEKPAPADDDETTPVDDQQ
jgi:ABC-type phosphate/phosphonate transport system substrate-binding protein